MSPFFLHIFNDSVSMDEEGEVADDLLAARTIALNGARELLCEQIKRGYLNSTTTSGSPTRPDKSFHVSISAKR